MLDLLVTFGLGTLRERLMDLHGAIRSQDLSNWLTKTPEELVAIWGEYHRTRVLPKLIQEFAACTEAGAGAGNPAGVHVRK